MIAIQESLKVMELLVAQHWAPGQLDCQKSECDGVDFCSFTGQVRTCSDDLW